ncbi:GLPGLI family protein [Frigoriflavimonas asaccharolytica]|uniref:GLPGLI family protein n=1 Tax=Frigoriflavimonas asaccharolytica TaxID=2735899 RepID=A0A8J8GBL9_9FLAO|nr:GLPGLI family protein [Frigoriflavimonas asaccharolytica]NRS92707.1 GLPGLI family protein [Frigoriflavimonas asaccharolytica]
MKDKFEDLNWIIQKEKKTLLTYECTLATTEFRGRKYKAWFTYDLKNNAFPWKLKGLPGVILAFEDESGIIKGEASKIYINSDLNMPTKFAEFFDSHRTNSIQFKKVILEINKYSADLESQDLANLPLGTKVKKGNPREFSVEKSFEWEKESSKP